MKALTLIKTVISIFIFYSCSHDLDCTIESKVFSDKWREKVKSIHKIPHSRSIYIIETFSNKEIQFCLRQDIINLASQGDSIIKDSYGFNTLLVTKEKDTFICRLTSTSCDAIVLKDLGFKKIYNGKDFVYVKKKKKYK